MNIPQPSLLDWTAPMARLTDPITSHEAANKAAMGASKGRMLVLEYLSHRPMTDFELADVTGWVQTSIGKRRLECQRAGLVDRAKDGNGDDMRRNTPQGSPALVWAITEKGRAYYARERPSP